MNNLTSVMRKGQTKIKGHFVKYQGHKRQRNTEELFHTWEPSARWNARWVGKRTSGDFPGVQWLRFRASNAEASGSIPGWGTKIPHATWPKNEKIE